MIGESATELMGRDNREDERQDRETGRRELERGRSML